MFHETSVDKFDIFKTEINSYIS